MNLSSRDQRQLLGRQAFSALHSIVRNARVHGRDNDAFGAPIEQLCLAIAELISIDGAFDLRIADDGIYVNRQAVRFEATTTSLAGWLRTELTGRRLQGFSASEVPPVEELRVLVQLFTPESAALTALPKLPTLKLHGQAGGQTAAQHSSRDTRLVDAYSHAVFFVGRYVELLRSGGQNIPVWAASRVVQDLVDMAAETPLRFLQLARTKAGGEAYWGYHAANVAVLSITFGARLGLERRRLHDLGMTALFHDVGMAALPQAILNKEESLEQRERAAVAASPLFAARAILREREVHAAALDRAQGALECHLERPAGVIGRILGICEAFDSLTTTRPWRKAHSPAVALQVMQSELARKLDPQLLPLFRQLAQRLE